MAYTAFKTFLVGEILTAATMNAQVSQNGLLGPVALATADGEVWIATGANAGEMVAILNSSNILKRANGGLEIDTSVAAAGDTLVAQDGTVWGLETAMSQAQAQAGSDTQVRGVSALRIKEAILSLATANIATGTYTGDGTTSQAITGVGFTVKYLRIVFRATTGAPIQAHGEMWTTDIIVDNHAGGLAYSETNVGDATGVPATLESAIIALGSDGFTVDDQGTNDHPNTQSATYEYVAIG